MSRPDPHPPQRKKLIRRCTPINANAKRIGPSPYPRPSAFICGLVFSEQISQIFRKAQADQAGRGTDIPVRH
jgi:hypothetical protein